MQWIRDTFGTDKPIIAMCHLQPMPGDPYYDADGGMNKVCDMAYSELSRLQEGGVDAVMFSNEFSMPYLRKARPATAAAMARVIGGLLPEIRVPFGVNVLWDPYASLDLAAATGARFLREIMSGVYASDFGLWDTNAGEVARHRAALRCENVKLLYNIVPEAAKYLAERDVAEIARSTAFNDRPDALCVSGIIAGAAADSSVLRRVKDAAPRTAVFANTGCKRETIAAILAVADGAVVGTTFKKDGLFENTVDVARVRAFMDEARAAR